MHYCDVIYYLGIINEDIMEIDNALESYTKAREFSPEIEDNHYRLGMLFYRTGKFKKAMEPLREYIIFQPDCNLLTQSLYQHHSEMN